MKVRELIGQLEDAFAFIITGLIIAKCSIAENPPTA